MWGSRRICLAVPGCPGCVLSLPTGGRRLRGAMMTRIGQLTKSRNGCQPYKAGGRSSSGIDQLVVGRTASGRVRERVRDGQARRLFCEQGSAATMSMPRRQALQAAVHNLANILACPATSSWDVGEKSALSLGHPGTSWHKMAQDGACCPAVTRPPRRGKAACESTRTA